ncbi:tetratricopeptide repeat-containing sensor histidine kinase [Fulvivirga maritima]|uniref:tetratricopeptide repeat protein n=1 Tax=Fulvivirga maritima TaxID=2904247 RepID=UPI001F29B25F|nr:tetratricopeptide repeat protein [Fulvivirga maritima]UII29410.1 tetratricopeptide repeat-containing sensor histidine kinase [Fulvivirga maritima]
MKKVNYKSKAEVARQLFVAYRNIDLDSALIYARVSSEYASYVGDSLTISRAEFCIGWVYERKGYYQDAVQHYHKSLQIANENGFDDRKKYILNNLGNANYFFGNYDDALRYHLESLKLREREGNLVEVAISCNNIGLVYYKIRDFDKAINFFDRALKIKKEIGDDTDLESILINLGLCYSELNRYKEALEFFDRILALCEVGCEDRMKIEAYNGAGIAYYSLGEIKKAKMYFEASNKLAIDDDFQMYHVINDHFLAKVLLAEQNTEGAISYLMKSLRGAENLRYRTWIRDNYQLLAEINALRKKYEEAYYYQRRYDSLNSQVLNEEVIQNLAKIQIEYQERENMETISMQQSQISRRTTLLLLSGIIIFLALVILVILYRNNFHRRKVNEKLSEANETIERQNHELTDINVKLEEKVRDRTKELKDSNAALLKSNHELDNFIYKTSHDIRGPLATLQGICNVALIDIKDAKAVDYFKKLGSTAKKLNEILSKLLIINQINNSLITEERVDFNDLIENVIVKQKKNQSGKKVKISKEIDDHLYFKSDVELLKIILNNLIGNAFKFYNTSSRVDSFVHITVKKLKADDVEIRVIDNGIGIEDKASIKIFEIFSKASEMGDSAGLGLYLVKLAVEKLEGDISLKRTEEGFTCFTVRFSNS